MYIGCYADAREAAKAVDVTRVFLVRLDDAFTSEATLTLFLAAKPINHNRMSRGHWESGGTLIVWRTRLSYIAYLHYGRLPVQRPAV